MQGHILKEAAEDSPLRATQERCLDWYSKGNHARIGSTRTSHAPQNTARNSLKCMVTLQQHEMLVLLTQSSKQRGANTLTGWSVRSHSLFGTDNRLPLPDASLRVRRAPQRLKGDGSTRTSVG